MLVSGQILWKIGLKDASMGSVKDIILLMFNKYFFSLPGKFDGISFNYQIMAILDLIRIIYYQEYIIEYPEEALESR